MTMSAVAAIQFDPSFSMGSRSSFGWPVLESGNHTLLGHDLGYTSDASLTPPPSGARSVTDSPPRLGLTAEQRELKRQRDQARRDSKAAARIRRTGSVSSYGQSPPSSVTDMSASPNLPIYTTAPSQMPLLTEPTTLGSHQYMPSPYTSPIPEQSHMFTNSYPTPYVTDPYASGYPASAASGLPTHYAPAAADPSMMYSMPPMMGAESAPSQEGGVRIVQSRPKPQCWEHGCNGRQFSTFSNLLRHQREKSGQATKAVCPNCGAEFTRTTARNGHLQHDKCKQRRSS